MQFGYNPKESQEAAERLRKGHKADMKFLASQHPSTASQPKAGLGFRIAKAQARQHLKTAQHEEAKTLKAVAAARRKETEALRRTKLTQQKTEAERKLQAGTRGQLDALEASRQAKKARLLTEQELRRAKMAPYVGALRETGKGVVAVGKTFWKGIKKLDQMGQEYARTHPHVDPILGTPRRPTTPYRVRTAPKPYAPQPRKPQRFVDFDPGKLELDPKELMK